MTQVVIYNCGRWVKVGQPFCASLKNLWVKFYSFIGK